jgi:hypothetical protein
MTIALMLEVDGKPPRWTHEDVAKLEATLEALERRHALDIDRPAERDNIRHALGALWSVLAAAADDPRYAPDRAVKA